MKYIYRLCGLLIGVIATVAFAIYTARNLTISDFSVYTSPLVLASIAIASLLYATIIPISAWAWRGMLIDVGIIKPWRELAIIMGTTQMAKYLPGNVGQHIGRTTMSLARGITIRPFLTTVFAETLLAVISAVFVGLMSALLSKAGLHALKLKNEMFFALILIGILIIGLLIYRPLVPHLLRRFAPTYAGSALETLLPRPPSLLRAFIAYCTNYLMIGTGLWILASALLPEMKHDFMLLLCSFSLAWVVGFFTPGAPAGLGVREAIMLGILGASYPGSEGVFIIISFRLVTVLGDSICFLTAYGMLLSHRHETPSC